jgi:hypothetical protein
VLVGDWFIEVKRRRRVASVAWLDIAEGKARAEGRRCAVCVHLVGSSSWLVLLSLSEFARLLGDELLRDGLRNMVEGESTIGGDTLRARRDVSR